jgi:hypothetical protein
VWAPAEAAARGCELHIVGALPSPFILDPLSAAVTVPWQAASVEVAQQGLEQAEAAARAVAADLRITSCLHPGRMQGLRCEDVRM